MKSKLQAATSGKTLPKTKVGFKSQSSEPLVLHRELNDALNSSSQALLCRQDKGRAGGTAPRAHGLRWAGGRPALKHTTGKNSRICSH